MKKVLAMLAAITVAMSLNANDVYAANNDDIVAPAYSYTKSCTSDLSISGSTAICESQAIGYYGTTTKINILQILQKKSSSGRWNPVDNWQETDLGYNGYALNTESGLTSGTYRLHTIFTVYTDDDHECFSKFSSEITI